MNINDVVKQGYRGGNQYNQAFFQEKILIERPDHSIETILVFATDGFYSEVRFVMQMGHSISLPTN
jgi:hypothetical protein